MRKQPSSGPALPARIPARNIPSATNGAALVSHPSKSPTNLHDGFVKIPNRSVSQASTASVASTTSSDTVIHKPAVPRKPIRLSSQSSVLPTTSSLQTAEAQKAIAVALEPPPPRRSNTKQLGTNSAASTTPARVSSARSLLDDDNDDELVKPGLPPRRDKSAFMDDPGGGGDSLSSWQPLKPS